jgi:hypothetical protein
VFRCRVFCGGDVVCGAAGVRLLWGIVGSGLAGCVAGYSSDHSVLSTQYSALGGMGVGLSYRVVILIVRWNEEVGGRW